MPKTGPHPLKLLRTHLCISQKEMADALGVWNTHLSKVERGHEPTSEELASKARQVYGRQLRRLGIEVEAG